MTELQLSIDFCVRARATDPATSHKAADNAKRFAGGHASKILAALKLHGPQSPKQLFDFTGLSVVQIDRRRGELIKAGLVRVKRLDDGAIAEHGGCAVLEAV
jgi:hypothetical protein